MTSADEQDPVASNDAAPEGATMTPAVMPAAGDTDSQTPRVVPAEERHPPLWWVGERFSLLIDALRDMTDDVLPQLEAVDESRLTPDALAAMDALPPTRRLRLKEAVTLLFEAPGDETEAAAEERGRLIDEAMHDAFQGDVHLIGTFAESLTTAAASPDRVSIMLNSMLLQAIAGFEVLVAGVATRFYLARPVALESQEKEFSLADLKSFGSVEDAIDELIAKKVSALMYGDLDGWSKWLSERCKADLPRLAIDWDVVRENFQRRHVLVHNGGLVSRQYLAKAPSLSGEPYEVGDRLRVDTDYLHAALDGLDVLGASIVLAARSTWGEVDIPDEGAIQLLKRVYALLHRERWSAVEKLASLWTLIEARASYKEALRANELCARSRLHGPQSIAKDAADWDVSASAARFQLVRAVLLEQFDVAFERIPDMVANNELSLGELLTWPILEPVRARTEWTALATALGIGQDESEPAE